MNQRNQKPPAGLSAPSKGKILDRLALIERDPERLLELFPNLTPEEQLGTLLFSPGELRQKLLRTTPLAKQLVSTLPVQEAHLTLMEIGPMDASFLLSLMTREQIQYISDLETWKRDGFSPAGFKKYLQIFKESGEDRLAQWLSILDPEVVVLALKAHGEVSKIDIFQDEVEQTDTRPYLSIDGYYRFHPEDEEFRSMLEPVLRILHTQSPTRYRMIMESAYQDMAAEVEEQAQQFRNGRLCDRGIPVFDEAVEIYRPLEDEQTKQRSKHPSPAERGPVNAAPLYPVRWMLPDSFLRKTLRVLADSPESDRIRMEMATLANKVLVADGLEVKDPEVLKYALRKAAGYMTLGLESLTGGDVKGSAEWLKRNWVHLLFRLGYTRVHQLTLRANRLREGSGFRWIDRYHFLADQPLEETLRGLLLRRPLFFEGVTETNWLGFREFGCLHDAQTTSDRLDLVETLSRIFLRLSLPPDRIKHICLEGGLGDLIDTIKWSQILNTLWACRILTGRAEFRLLSLPETRRFLQIALASQKDRSSRTFGPGYAQDLTRWLQGHDFALQDKDLTHLHDWILACADRMEQELGTLRPAQVPDPRTISCLCIRILPTTS